MVAWGAVLLNFLDVVMLLDSMDDGAGGVAHFGSGECSGGSGCSAACYCSGSSGHALSL